MARLRDHSLDWASSNVILSRVPAFYYTRPLRKESLRLRERLNELDTLTCKKNDWAIDGSSIMFACFWVDDLRVCVYRPEVNCEMLSRPNTKFPVYDSRLSTVPIKLVRASRAVNRELSSPPGALDFPIHCCFTTYYTVFLNETVAGVH